MRVLNQLGEIYDNSPQFPYGTIQNETDTQDGTPVIRELYGDIVTNLYKILLLTGVAPNGTEDSENTQYQLVEAIRKLPNLLNDSEQVLTKSGTVWSVPFNLSLLPNKYFFIAKASDDYVSGTFRGVNVSPSYTFTSAGFSVGDEVLVIIDSAGVKAHSLTSISSAGADMITTVLGIPIAYSELTDVYYREEGNLLNDVPRVEFLEDSIRDYISDNAITITDMFILQGRVLCVCFYNTTITYKCFQFSLDDFTSPEEVYFTGIPMPTGTDNEPHFYCDGDNIYISNAGGATSVDNDFVTAVYDAEDKTITYLSSISLSPEFVKSTNIAALQKRLYSFVGGDFCFFDLNTGAKNDICELNGINGNLFSLGGSLYFTSGEIAKKWA